MLEGEITCDYVKSVLEGLTWLNLTRLLNAFIKQEEHEITYTTIQFVITWIGLAERLHMQSFLATAFA